MPKRIRTFESADAAGLAAIYIESVRGLASTKYSARQVEAWAGLAPDAASLRERYAGRYRCFVADKQDVGPVAFAYVGDDGHIGYFYARPGYTRCGATAALYEALESRAHGLRLARLRVEASEMARGFFSRRGFALLSRQDLVIGAVEIHNYRMEKSLVAPLES